MPVVHSVSFGYDDVDHWEAVALDEVEGDVYSRNTNPTVATFEEKVRTSRSRRNHRCVPGDEQSRRVHRRGTGGHGHPGEPNSLLGRD
jgi:cystathionine beta-lyase/cystathionine gamma-synthase